MELTIVSDREDSDDGKMGNCNDSGGIKSSQTVSDAMVLEKLTFLVRKKPKIEKSTKKKKSKKKMYQEKELSKKRKRSTITPLPLATSPTSQPAHKKKKRSF
eukprot:TRINITY_DN14200_c0_g1_i1.p2 TRINITY_DN14200_c0_g1~~TRINITY_DN14200_c0_g1_i1.p2  ORF type:complete len:102 (-),score=22.89 TRINITY_DN14200_c0_g1_i1:128-433(-)